MATSVLQYMADVPGRYIVLLKPVFPRLFWVFLSLVSVILGLCVLYVFRHASHRLPRTLKPPPHIFRICSAPSRAVVHLLPLWDCSNHCSHHGFFSCSSASASSAPHAPSRVLDAPPLRDLRSFFPFLHSLILCACRCVSSYCTMITRLFSVLAERVHIVLRLRFQQLVTVIHHGTGRELHVKLASR